MLHGIKTRATLVIDHLSAALLFFFYISPHQGLGYCEGMIRLILIA
jgi:hypothetical protein